MGDMFLLYLLTRLEAIKLLCLFVCLGYFIITVIWFLMSLDDSSYYSSKAKEKMSDTSKLYIPIISTILLVLLPTKEDMMFVVAGTGIMEIAKNEDIKRIAGKSVTIFEKYLDDMMKEEKK